MEQKNLKIFHILEQKKTILLESGYWRKINVTKNKKLGERGRKG